MTERSVPLAVYDHNVAILDRTGSGRSDAARGIVEHWLGTGRRVCIVDPTEVWFGPLSEVELGDLRALLKVSDEEPKTNAAALRAQLEEAECRSLERSSRLRSSVRLRQGR